MTFPNTNFIDGQTVIEADWLNAVNEKCMEVISVKNFGAVGDGVTDDTAAISAAFTYAATQLNPVVYFPTGTYSVTSSATTQFPIVNGMEVYGDGMDASIIKWTANNPGSTIRLFGSVGGANISSATIRDLAIRGDHDTSGYVSNSSYPILVYSCQSLRIHRVKVTYSRVMAIAVRASYSVDIDGCVVQYCARDGINTANCNFVKITNNRVEYIDDDSIAGHTDTAEVADRNYVVCGNIIRFAQGIKLLAARSATIVGNTLEYCFGEGIDVDTNSEPTVPAEGEAANQGVTITGNTIKNMFNRQYIDNLNQGAPYISISGISARAGTSVVIPGNPDPATGLTESPYPYYYTANNQSLTQPIANSINITVSGNTFARDMYPTAKISDYGFGSFYTRNGPVDPAVIPSAYNNEGVRLSYDVRNINITENIFSGIYSGLYLTGVAKLTNCNFSNNIVYDCAYGVVVSGSNTLHQNLKIANNVFDLDPFFASTNRGTNGTWLVSGNPTAIYIQNSFGYSLSGNTFKNCCRICDANLSSVFTLQGSKLSIDNNNFMECDPVVTGFSTSNKGIGLIPQANKFILKVVDSDPNSATYGNILNFCPIQSNEVPTSGKYVAGHVVWKNNPAVLGTAGSQYIVSGWSRVTTGSSNVVGTDWFEMRTLTGT